MAASAEVTPASAAALSRAVLAAEASPDVLLAALSNLTNWSELGRLWSNLAWL